MALQYEMEVLDELIFETLHPRNLINENTSVSGQIAKPWLGKALSEKNRIRKKFKAVTYSFPKEKHRRLYIQQHQLSLIRLQDRLFNYLCPKDTAEMREKKTDSPLEKLYKKTFDYCSELLQYLQETFPCYFSHDFNMPEYELMQAQEQWKVRLQSLRSGLLKVKPDKKLVSILFNTLNNLCDHTILNSLSYRTHAYINELMAGLENIKEIRKLNSTCPPLNVLLIRFDFNDTEFKDYLVETICNNVNLLKTAKEKIDRLSFYYKEIGQIQRKTGHSYNPRARSVKDDLKEWLVREIKYLEKSENLGILVPASFHESPQYRRGIWYTYTIEELALLQRVQYEASYIANTNIIAMMEDLSRFAHTATQHNISYKNLKNLFYNIDLATIDSMHNKFLFMIRKLQDLKAGIVKKEKLKKTQGRK